MKIVQQRHWVRLILISMLVLSGMLLSACDSTNTAPTSNNSLTGNSATPMTAGKGCTKVGILLPETVSSVRWETKDHPLLVKAIQEAIPGVHIDYDNDAQGDSATQLSQAKKDLENGDCILVVGAHDSVAAASIVAVAKTYNVPVIAYDRLIQSKDLSYYVSFDNIKVGQLQGQYIADHYLEYQNNNAVNIAIINGSQTDANALLFSLGVHSALDPLFANGALKTVSENFIANWDNNIAQSQMAATLTDQRNNIQIAYVANDGMAGGVINALYAAGLDKKVLVTGQDATAAGVHSILKGDQNMTVYKPIAKEAQSVGDLVRALYAGSNVNTVTHNQTITTYDGGDIPAILDAPISIDLNNIASTVLADNYLTKQDICMDLPAGTAGIC
jgi:D-xylose transport system substrate-binding protein